MSFALTPTYEDNPRLQSLVERLRDYLDGELAEYEAELGLTQESHYIRETLEPVWRRSRELGFYGIHLPTELGGQNLTFTELAALKEEVGASPRVSRRPCSETWVAHSARDRSFNTPPSTSWKST